MSTDTEWITRITAARDGADRAAAEFEQAVRDAAAAGVSESAIAREALGTASRKKVRAILGRAPQAADAPRHAPVAVVYDARRDLQKGVERALWARGWILADAAEAAHLARGGVPVVACRLRDGAARLCQQRAVYRDGLVLQDDGAPRTALVEEEKDGTDRMGRPARIRATSPEAVARAITATL